MGCRIENIFIIGKYDPILITFCNIDTFHLRWAQLPTQHEENAECNTGFKETRLFLFYKQLLFFITFKGFDWYSS